MENLSSVEEAWSEKTGDESHARAALAACDDALEGYRRARADNDVERAARSRDRLAAKLAVVPKAAELHDD
jgi:hypothetical protein